MAQYTSSSKCLVWYQSPRLKDGCFFQPRLLHGEQTLRTSSRTCCSSANVLEIRRTGFCVQTLVRYLATARFPYIFNTYTFTQFNFMCMMYTHGPPNRCLFGTEILCERCQVPHAASIHPHIGGQWQAWSEAK